MKIVWISFLLLLLATGCSQPRIEGAESNGTIFRHRWWNYYNRALDAAERGEFGSAKADLVQALDRRVSDQRMARTYGMHFIDYFPHRELGIVYWLEGDLAAAQTELELSIRQHPTTKARYYLDQVRKALILKRGGAIEPPRLMLHRPAEPFWTRDDPIRVQGQAQDPNYISEVMINAASLYLEGAQNTFDFSHDLTLPQGAHTITVVVQNLAGQTCKQEFVLHVDRQGPAMVVDRIHSRDAQIVIEGSFMDAAGVASVTIDGVPHPISVAAEVSFSHRIPENQKAITIQCKDRLANETIVHLTPQEWADPVNSPKIVASLNLAGLFDARDKNPPVIQLDGWEDSQTVYMGRVVLTGTVRDLDQVTALSINGQPALPRKTALVYFSQILELREGANPIIISARDSVGNTAERRIVVVRKTPEAKLLAHRLRLSIFGFAQKGQQPAILDAFQDNFIHQMVQGHRFQVIEREQLGILLQEQKISQTQLADSATAIRIGRLAAAQSIITGSLIDTHTGIEVVAKVVDCETAEILATVDAYTEEKQLSGMKSLAEAISLQIHREFPLADGSVMERRKQTILTDLGSNQLRAQRSILIYSEHPVYHPDSGRFLGFEHIVLGRARICQLNTRHSQATLNDGCDPAIAPLHKVLPQ